jgi:hypothetical protein
LRQTVRSGIERARGYGLTKRGAVRLFIELNVWFGSAFDTDPLHPWARAILTDPEITDQVVRAQRLHERAGDYHEQVWGPRGVQAIAALRRIQRTPLEAWLPPREDEAVEAAVGKLQELYPEKCAAAGVAALRALARAAFLRAQRFQQFPTTLGASLFVALAFAIGHGFDHDPLYPWIPRSLSDSRIADPNVRLERLHAKAMTYLSNAIAYFEEEGVRDV